MEAQKQQNVVLAAQAAKDRSDYQNTVATLTAANTALQQGILKLEASLAAQKKADQTMPLPDLANRWALLGGLNSNEIQSVPGGINVTESGARKTTVAFEEISTLKKELDNQQQICNNKDTEIKACQKSLDSETAFVAGKDNK